jgi:hypothetical protein
MDFRRWNYNCAFYYYYLISDNRENLSNKQAQHFTFVSMGNLPALLPNATPLVNRFFAGMSKKRQRCVVLT